MASLLSLCTTCPFTFKPLKGPSVRPVQYLSGCSPTPHPSLIYSKTATKGGVVSCARRSWRRGLNLKVAFHPTTAPSRLTIGYVSYHRDRFEDSGAQGTHVAEHSFWRRSRCYRLWTVLHVFAKYKHCQDHRIPDPRRRGTGSDPERHDRYRSSRLRHASSHGTACDYASELVWICGSNHRNYGGDKYLREQGI